jgi:hypothetical protein
MDVFGALCSFGKLGGAKNPQVQHHCIRNFGSSPLGRGCGSDPGLAPASEAKSPAYRAQFV